MARTGANTVGTVETNAVRMVEVGTAGMSETGTVGTVETGAEGMPKTGATTSSSFKVSTIKRKDIRNGWRLHQKVKGKLNKYERYVPMASAS